MKLVLSTGSLYTYSLERVFAMAKKAGFEGLELMCDARWDTRDAGFVQSLIGRYSIDISAVHSPFSAVPGWPADYPGLIKESVRLAEAIGAKVVVHHLPQRCALVSVQVESARVRIPIFGWNPQRDYLRWLETDYPMLQSQTNVLLCIENMPTVKLAGHSINAHAWNAASGETMDAITRFPNLTMDTTHLGTWGLEPALVYGRWGERVKHIHFSNFNGQEHRLPEDGKLMLNLLMMRLINANYSGAVSFELLPDALDAGQSDEHITAVMARSLAMVRTWLDSPVETGSA